MKSRMLTCITAMALFATLAMPAPCKGSGLTRSRSQGVSSLHLASTSFMLTAHTSASTGIRHTPPTLASGSAWETESSCFRRRSSRVTIRGF